jgi:hypothetical protein
VAEVSATIRIGESAGFLAVGGVARQAGGQLAARRVDRRLHLPRRAVDAAGEVELQHPGRTEGGVEVISVTPAICPSTRSSGPATVAAITSGLAPGRLAETEMVGYSTWAAAPPGAAGRR